MGGTQLVSPVTEQAGWFSTLHPDMPMLPAGGGFAIDFSLRLVDENHTSPDRAGFSLIVLNDAAIGIELGFWTEHVWAQNDSPLFTHGEDVFFDTRQRSDYRLSFTATDYALFADGGLILSGALRDYSAHANPVYGLSNFLFFGDNTHSAGADVVLHSVAVDATAGAIPMPLALCLILPLWFGLAAERRGLRRY